MENWRGRSFRWRSGNPNHYKTPTLSACSITRSLLPRFKAVIGVSPSKYGLGRTNQLTLAMGETWRALNTSGKPSTTPSGPTGSNCQWGKRHTPRSRTASRLLLLTRSCGVCREVPNSCATSDALNASANNRRRHSKFRRREVNSNSCRSRSSG